MRVTLIHNPNAGENDHAGEALRSLVANAGHDVGSYRSMRQAGWEEALANPGDLVVVAGGDGSVGKVFREVAPNDVPVTLLPLGSANNVARSLGIADVEVERLVGGWAGGDLRRFDVCEARAPWGDKGFVESIRGGIFGEVLSRAARIESTDGVGAEGEEKVELGLELLRDVIEGMPALGWQIEVDGIDVSGEFLAVEVMNIGEMGPNLPLAPNADPGDGLLEVVLIGAEDRASLVAYLSERLRDLEPAPPELPRRRGKVIMLGPPVESQLHVDDRFWPDDPDERGEGTAVVTCRWPLPVLVPRV
jgi:diacylglycerol kinase (ATP)